MPADQLISVASLVLAAFVQAAVLLIWGAALTQRVRQAERQIERLLSLPERMARLESGQHVTSRARRRRLAC